MAIVGRLLEAQGFRVGIIAQPDWRSTADFSGSAARTCSSASPPATWTRWSTATPPTGACAATTPTRRTAPAASAPTARVIVYAQRVREAFARRADRDRRHRGQPAPHRALRLLVGQGAPLDPARRAAPTCSSTATPSGRSSRSRIASRPARRDRDISDVRGTALRRHARRATAGPRSTRRSSTRRGPSTRRPDPYAMEPARAAAAAKRGAEPGVHVVRFTRRVPTARSRRTASSACPRFEQVRDDPVLYAHASRILHLETNPGNARALVQRHGDSDVWINPPPMPLTTAEMDALYELPYRARAASRVRRREDPGVRDDPLLGHDPARLLRRLHVLLDHRARGPHHPEPLARTRSCARSRRSATRCPGFTGVISDLGGPTANMYRLACKSREIESACRRPSCVYPGDLREPRTPTTRR